MDGRARLAELARRSWQSALPAGMYRELLTRANAWRPRSQLDRETRSVDLAGDTNRRRRRRASRATPALKTGQSSLAPGHPGARQSPAGCRRSAVPHRPRSLAGQRARPALLLELLEHGGPQPHLGPRPGCSSATGTEAEGPHLEALLAEECCSRIRKWHRGGSCVTAWRESWPAMSRRGYEELVSIRPLRRMALPTAEREELRVRAAGGRNEPRCEPGAPMRSAPSANLIPCSFQALSGNLHG